MQKAITINEITTNTANGSTYTCKNVQVLGNTFGIMEVKGKVNYINVVKKTNNPFVTLGNAFASWEDAAKHYKSPAMKTALMMAEIEFNSLTK